MMSRFVFSLLTGAVLSTAPWTLAEDAPSADEGGQWAPVDRAHWAFRPPVDSEARSGASERGGDHGVDRYIGAALQEMGLEFSQEADRRDLIRRVTFDLTGLPPSPEDVAAFVQDDSPDAYERLVDRLLGSRHYGEKWAQFWLDVIRFAETEGFEYDRHLPDAWRFRDYVIRSFNEDKPFDLFIREQIAGDEMEPATQDALIAAGFHRHGAVRRNAGNPDIALSRNEVLTERTDIVGSAILGLSIGCARCHDHKFDPITQEDYYSLQAYFGATQEHNEVIATDAERERWEAESAKLNEAIGDLKKRYSTAEGAERGALKRRIEDLEKQLPEPLPMITTIRNDFTQRTEVRVLRRGDWGRKGDIVQMRPPGALLDADAMALSQDTPRPRSRLADWLTDTRNPLTARVIVNRIWQGHFGVGLVGSPNDFGKNGEPPSHPELLDHLAVRFMEMGWRFKELHRYILTSRVYRQSSRTQISDQVRSLDPENRLLWRFNRRRLTAEEIRDSMLMVSGRLNPELFGPSVMLPVPESMIQLLYKPEQWVVTEDTSQRNRRSIYLISKRNLRMPFLEVFDQPALMTSCARRETSTHAPQALELLNGRMSNEFADALAERLKRDTGGAADPDDIIERAYQLGVGRKPTRVELDLARSFLEEDPPLREFALAIFNLNDFLYVY